MSEYNTQIIEQFRANAGHVGGEWQDSPLLLLHHVGARTGAERVTPLGCARHGENYVVIASNGGSAAHPAWYHNLIAPPETTIEIGADTVPVHARETEGDEREQLFVLIAQGAPQIIDHQARVARASPSSCLHRGLRSRSAFFDGRTAAELRLWDALGADLLCPFHYFGLAAGTDLSGIGWRRGAYDVAGLSVLYTGNDARAAGSQAVAGQGRRRSRDALPRVLRVDSTRGVRSCTQLRRAAGPPAET